LFLLDLGCYKPTPLKRISTSRLRKASTKTIVLCGYSQVLGSHFNYSKLKDLIVSSLRNDYKSDDLHHRTYNWLVFWIIVWVLLHRLLL
jgi:hypothetical protein